MELRNLYNYVKDEKFQSALTISVIEEDGERVATYIDYYTEPAWLLIEINPLQIDKFKEIIDCMDSERVNPYDFKEIRTKADVEIVELSQNNYEVKEMSEGEIFSTKRKNNPRKIEE